MRITSTALQVDEADTRLQGMQSKTNLVSKSDWDKVEKVRLAHSGSSASGPISSVRRLQVAGTNVALWAKRRRAFRDIWYAHAGSVWRSASHMLALSRLELCRR